MYMVRAALNGVKEGVVESFSMRISWETDIWTYVGLVMERPYISGQKNSAICDKDILVDLNFAFYSKLFLQQVVINLSRRL